MEITESEFYRLATQIANQSRQAAFASKTPVLLLPSEQQGKWRTEYNQTLLKRIKNGKQKTQYLFSIPHLKSELNKLNKTAAEKVLDWWATLLTYKTLDLRATERPFESCVIGDSQILLKEGTKRFLISTNFSKGAELAKEFNKYFKSASSNNNIINQIRRAL
ncbi:MAG TPA: hypothetical protein VJA47_04380 [archaeon]|nr:hypothetical protein [archaeon]